MVNEENTPNVSRSFEEDEEEKDTSTVTPDVFGVENCPATCPTCQQSCSYTAGHGGLHHCADGHEWV